MTSYLMIATHKKHTELLRAGFNEVKSYHCLLAELTSSPLPAVDETNAKGEAALPYLMYTIIEYSL